MRLPVTAVGVVMVFALVGNGWGDSLGGALLDKSSTTVAIYRQTQKVKERWAVEKAQLIKQRNTMTRDRETLLATKASLEVTLEKTGEAIDRLRRDLKAQQAGASHPDLERFLVTLLDQLTTYIADGLPFLLKERETRVAVLRALLEDKHAGIGEKVRRTLEALLIEIEYGRTVEAYEEVIAVGNQSLTATILRVGGGALFYQSPDGLQVGRYSVGENRWERLPSSYAGTIRTALEVGRQQRAATLIDLPVGRVVQ